MPAQPDAPEAAANEPVPTDAPAPAEGAVPPVGDEPPPSECVPPSGDAPPPGDGGAPPGSTGAAARPRARRPEVRGPASASSSDASGPLLERSSTRIWRCSVPRWPSSAEQVKQIAAFVGGIVVLALYAVSLLAIGGTLFLGEWLFGSIGWGVLHGTLLAVGIIITLALLIIDAPRPLITRPLAWGAAIGIATTVGAGLQRAAQPLRVGGRPGHRQRGRRSIHSTRRSVVAMVVFALVFAIVGLYLGARSEGGLGAIQGLVVGALVGALFGILFGGLVFSWQPAAAIGVTVGLITWIALMGWRASKANLDPQARFEKLWPRETYETALETKAWLEQEWTNRLPRPGSK